MTENQKQPIGSDEIDLLELLGKLIGVLKTNSKLIIVSILIGTILGLCYSQLAPKIYESRMLISSDILTESYSKILTTDLNQLLSENNYDVLSSKLKISPAYASKIKSIDVAIEKPNVKIIAPKTNEKNYLTITCQTEDNSIWADLQKGLIIFFEINDYVSIRVSQKKEYFNQMIGKIDKELLDLSELKIRILNSQITQSNKDNSILFDPTTVNSKILELNKEKINLQNSLELVNSIQLVEGFTVFNKPTSPKLSVSLVAGSSLGLFFVALIIVFKSLRKIIRLSEEKLANS
jgi:LPS O-antigen subunit length determinant protein (WzzB/FepE family)